MGNCCSGRGNLTNAKAEGQSVILARDSVHDVVDKGLFSSIGASYVSNKQGYINKHFSVTSVNDKKATAELL